MLTQHPVLPVFGITGDYYPSPSTPSTVTRSQALGHPAVGFCATTFLSHNLCIQGIPVSDCRLHTVSTSPHYIQHSSSNAYPNRHININNSVMPRPHPPAIDPTEAPSFPGPPPVLPGGPTATGCKRHASAVSGHAAPVANMEPLNDTGVQLESVDQANLRLPPKPKESERMMHIQRWVNNLPVDRSNPSYNSAVATTTYIPWNHGACSTGYRRVNEDREFTPPPGRPYLSHLPFTPEERQTLMRFLHTDSDHQRHQHPAALIPHHAAGAAAGAMPHHPHNHHHPPPYQHTNNQLHAPVPHQQVSNNQQTPQQTVPKQLGAAADRWNNGKFSSGGNRLFADWETRLITRLFQEYFINTGESVPNNLSVTLPSLSVVRSRIARSPLEDTRTATAVRAKIRRMQTSGAVRNEFQRQ